MPNADTMTRTNKLDSSKVCFDKVYRPRMLREMDVFHPMFYDTRGRGRAVLRHAPHVVVMTTVRYPSSWEGRAETHSPCCCDDDGQMPARRG